MAPILRLLHDHGRPIELDEEHAARRGQRDAQPCRVDRADEEAHLLLLLEAAHRIGARLGCGVTVDTDGALAEGLAQLRLLKG